LKYDIWWQQILIIFHIISLPNLVKFKQYRGKQGWRVTKTLKLGWAVARMFAPALGL